MASGSSSTSVSLQKSPSSKSYFEIVMRVIEIVLLAATAVATCISVLTSYQAIQLSKQTMDDQKEFSEAIKKYFTKLNKNLDNIQGAVGQSTAILDQIKTDFGITFEQTKNVLSNTSHDIEKMFFQWAIDQATINCPSCQSCPFSIQSCSRSPAMRRYLEVAARIEPRIQKELSPADYNTLAAMGSYYWDYRKLESYCECATEDARSPTEVDSYYTYSILGCLNYQYCDIDVKLYHNKPSIDNARKDFDEAIREIEKTPLTDINIFNRCYAYTIRSAWEIIHNVQIVDGRPKYSENEESKKYNSQEENVLKVLERRNPVLHKSIDLYLKSIINAANSGNPPTIPCFPWSIPKEKEGGCASTQSGAQESNPQETRPIAPVPAPELGPGGEHEEKLRLKPQDKAKQQPTPAPRETRPQGPAKTSETYRFFSNQDGHIPQNPIPPWQRSPQR